MLPAGESEFAGHVTQSAAASLLLYVPVLQFWQACAEMALVFAEYLPRAHVKHTEDPFVFLYVPDGQRIHTLPSTPVHPALHVQRVSPLATLLAPMLHGSHGPPS